MLKGDDSGWKLVTVDESKGRGKAPRCLQVAIHSAAFQVIVMMVNVANAFVAASISFVHDERPREDFFKTYYFAEVVLPAQLATVDCLASCVSTTAGF